MEAQGSQAVGTKGRSTTILSIQELGKPIRPCFFSWETMFFRNSI
jgi:hypothetical protein